MDRQIIIPDKPNFFNEAHILMYDYFAHLEAKHEAVPWHEKPLVTKPGTFSLAPEVINEMFPDVRQYISRCRKEATPLLEGQDDLQNLFRVVVGASEGKLDGENFLIGLLVMLDIEDAADLQRDEFVSMALLELNILARDEVEMPGAIDELTSPAFEISEIFSIVNEVAIDDAKRMTLLRFFQEIDAWFEKLKDLLLKLQKICQKHYPLVEKRFIENVAQLKKEGAEAYAFQWLSRITFDLTTFRPKDPITLQLSLIIYNGMSFRFSTVERLPLLILFGILVDDLSALQDRQRVRDELTERQLKAIADQTRLEILRSLSRGEQYVQQLADQLQLTAATLSHHLNQLLAVMLVGLRGEGRRNYYHLNRNELSALAADLNRLAGNYGEK